MVKEGSLGAAVCIERMGRRGRWVKEGIWRYRKSLDGAVQAGRSFDVIVKLIENVCAAYSQVPLKVPITCLVYVFGKLWISRW